MCFGDEKETVAGSAPRGSSAQATASAHLSWVRGREPEVGGDLRQRIPKVVKTCFCETVFHTSLSHLSPFVLWSFALASRGSHIIVPKIPIYEEKRNVSIRFLPTQISIHAHQLRRCDGTFLSSHLCYLDLV